MPTLSTVPMQPTLSPRALWLSLLLAACGGGTGTDAGSCPASPLAVGATEVVVSGLTGTEGLTFSPDGRLFVASGDVVLEVFANGTTRKLADVPTTVGTAWWNGALYVASGDDGTHAPGNFCDATRKGALYKVTPEGAVTRFATGIRAPNFLAVAPWGELLVADDCLSNTALYAVSAQGVVRPWLEGIPSANGLGFDAAGTTLYVAATFTTPSKLWKVSVTPAGQPGTPVPVVDFPEGAFADGLTLGADGAVYVALNARGEISRVKDGVAQSLASGLLTAASLEFGRGAAWDPCSVYVSSLIGDKVYRLRLGTRGLALRE